MARQISWVLGLLLTQGAAPPAGAWSAAAGGASSEFGVRLVESATEREDLLVAPFRLRHPAACLAFGASRAERPAGASNAYEFGLAWSGSDSWLPQALGFVDNVGADDAFYRSVSGARVFDALERGAHEIAWSARKSGAAAATLSAGPGDLALACAKREIPWRDGGELPARTSAAVGGFTGADADVTSFGHYDPLIELSFTSTRPLHCIAVASGGATNPSHGHVDQRYELLLSRAGEAGTLPVQRVEHDDEPDLLEPASLPVSAVRFFPDVEAGAQTFTWWGIQFAGGTDIMTLAYPTLGVACTRQRLGPEPFKGRAAVGGAHASGQVEVTGDAGQELVALEFALARSTTCAVFASAWATNPAGLTVGNVYRFGLSADGMVPGWDVLLEFDDNPGVDDLGALPVADTALFELERGEHVLRFEAVKQDAADADLTVSSPSVAVFCARKALGVR